MMRDVFTGMLKAFMFNALTSTTAFLKGKSLVEFGSFQLQGKLQCQKMRPTPHVPRPLA